MAAGKHDFTIEQGATWERTVTIKDDGVLRPLTDYTARMQLRQGFASTNIILELTTENGRIIITDPGIVKLALTAETTATLAKLSVRYDLELVSPDDEVDRVLEGLVKLTLEVTR